MTNGAAMTQKQQASTKKLATRKKPSQSRSQEKVQRILDSTRQLLIDGGGSASANLTTHRIAKKAGIAVGTVYQYFPNVESVLYAIYKEFADHARALLSEFDSATQLGKPRDVFFEELVRRLTSSREQELDIIRAIRTETRVYSSLAAMEQEQAEFIAGEFAKFLKYYGSTWSQERLERLGLFIFYQDWATWQYRGHAGVVSDEEQEWGILVFKTMIDHCFDA